jgi:prophage regulatory protein
MGLFPKSIRIARNASRWPSHEVIAVNKANIAGKNKDEIRALVAELHAARSGQNQAA